MDEINGRKRFLTKRPFMATGSVRMPPQTIALLREAAMAEGISQSEFLRRATNAEATRILRRQRKIARASGENSQSVTG